jgi:hypothetical protein
MQKELQFDQKYRTANGDYIWHTRRFNWIYEVLSFFRRE